MAIQVGGVSGQRDEVDALDGVPERDVIRDAGVEDGDLDSFSPQRVVAGHAQPIEQAVAERNSARLSPGAELWDIDRVDETRFLRAIQHCEQVVLVAETDEEGVELVEPSEQIHAASEFCEKGLERGLVLENEHPLVRDRAVVDGRHVEASGFSALTGFRFQSWIILKRGFRFRCL